MTKLTSYAVEENADVAGLVWRFAKTRIGRREAEEEVFARRFIITIVNDLLHLVWVVLVYASCAV